MVVGLVGVAALVLGFALAWALSSRVRARLQHEAEALRVDIAEARALLEAEKQKTTWTDEAKQQLKDTFKALASDELLEKASQLKTDAKGELGGVVDPLKTELEKLDKYVRELEGKREGAYSEIGTQLTLLQTLQDSLKQQTTTLAQALRAPTVRGRWGEVQLRRIAELAGMQDHVDFDEQQSGESGRPDMIVRLPLGGLLPIDSKVSLGDFLQAMDTDDEESRKHGLVRHAKALRGRVRELSQKAYWEQFKEDTPEVVVMFVPIEASLGAAFQHDPELFEYALSNRVLVVSPVVLFALLKTVAHSWQQQQLAENAAQIAEQGKSLYDCVVRFVGHFTGVGASLQSSIKKYNEAVGTLEGRLLPASRRFRDMIVVSKEIDSPTQIDVQPRVPSLQPGESDQGESQ